MEGGSLPSLGQFILLGTSSMITAVLYSIYRQKAQVAQELKVSAEAGLASPAPRAERNPGPTGPQRTRGREGTPGTRCGEAAQLRSPWSYFECHPFVLKLFLEKLLCTR